MGRSVSYPSGAVVAFAHLDLEDCEDQDAVDWAYETAQDFFTESCRTTWPSLEECDTWLGREDHALLRNRHAYFGMSTYCGVIAYWLVMHGDAGSPALAERWIAQVAADFQATFGSLRKIGTASNGESFYEAA